MVYQMELRLSFSQQLAEGLRGGGHQLTAFMSLDYKVIRKWRIYDKAILSSQLVGNLKISVVPEGWAQ